MDLVEKIKERERGLLLALVASLSLATSSNP